MDCCHSAFGRSLEECGRLATGRLSRHLSGDVVKGLYDVVRRVRLAKDGPFSVRSSFVTFRRPEVTVIDAGGQRSRTAWASLSSTGSHC